MRLQPLPSAFGTRKPLVHTHTKPTTSRRTIPFSLYSIPICRFSNGLFLRWVSGSVFKTESGTKKSKFPLCSLLTPCSLPAVRLQLPYLQPLYFPCVNLYVTFSGCLIALGGMIGKVSIWQFLFLSFWQTIFYSANYILGTSFLLLHQADPFCRRSLNRQMLCLTICRFQDVEGC